MRPFSVIVAAAVPNWGIGQNGTLPWKIPEDMKFFKEITSKCTSPNKRNAVVMGRKTYLSIPQKFRPLPNRLNVVLTRNPQELQCSLGDSISNDTVLICDSFEAALTQLNDEQYQNEIENVFVMGGAQIYNYAFHLSQFLDTFYLTRVFGDFECDTFLEFDLSQFVSADAALPQVHKSESTGILFEWVTLKNRWSGLATPRKIVSSENAHEEYQYLNLIRDIIETGVERPDRTGVGTLSKFGCTMRFSLRDNVFPLLTTKRVFWRGVAEELLWFVKGCTNANELAEKNIHIWDGNGSREFLDSRGLTHLEEGDLGAVYGFQWRHFGAKYTNMHADYAGQGVDQLKQVIETIKTNPTDRRMVMTAWNPAALHEMALPPCHMFCQFYVANGELSCQMYQRSCDMGLGVPFNIASYALLTRLVAQVCGLECGDFVHVLGDTHVYLNHVDPLKIQLEREPRPFPVLKINPEKKEIDDFVYQDFEIVGYKPHKRIKMQMAV